MLKVLIVAATGSLAFEYIGSDPDHYSTGKFFAEFLEVLQPPSLSFLGLVEA